MCACAFMHTPTSLSVGVYVSMSQSESENNLGCVFLPSTLFDTGSLYSKLCMPSWPML